MTPTERQTVIQALEAVDALIDHQFTGTSRGMTALQHACDDCREALGIMREEEKPGPPPLTNAQTRAILDAMPIAKRKD